jgi:hypothetical protein
MNTLDTTINDSVLAGHAAEIRRLGKRVADDVIEIGRRLAECRRILKEDGSWRDGELKLSPQSAGRLIQVYEQRSNLEHLDLPVSALYLLAAPSTPQEARDEVIERAQAGESISVAEVEQVVEASKGKQKARKARKPTTTKPKLEKKERDASAFNAQPRDADAALKPLHDHAFGNSLITLAKRPERCKDTSYG